MPWGQERRRNLQISSSVKWAITFYWYWSFKE